MSACFVTIGELVLRSSDSLQRMYNSMLFDVNLQPEICTTALHLPKTLVTMLQ